MAAEVKTVQAFKGNQRAAVRMALRGLMRMYHYAQQAPAGAPILWLPPGTEFAFVIARLEDALAGRFPGWPYLHP